jgi:hypothetical protein
MVREQFNCYSKYSNYPTTMRNAIIGMYMGYKRVRNIDHVLRNAIIGMYMGYKRVRNIDHVLRKSKYPHLYNPKLTLIFGYNLFPILIAWGYTLLS